MQTPKMFLILSESWTMADPRDMRTFAGLATVAEEAGIDGIMIGEHVVAGPNAAYLGVPRNPRDWIKAGNQDPSYPHPSNLVLLSAMAAVTERVRLLAGGLLTPLRHPLVVAKDLATLDLVSNGRLIFMPSVSWQEEEYAALDVRFDRRGEILDEQLEIWDRLWRGGSPVSHAGRHFRFSDIYVEPQPFRPEGPELWIGARKFAPWAVRRAVRQAKGFFPIVPPTDDELALLRQELVRAGRDPDDLELGAFLFGPAFEGEADLLDLSKALEPVPDLVERGFSTLVIKPSQYIDDVDQLGDFCRTVLENIKS
jgi:probable F420-dependent oxidoreductase